MNQDLAKAKDPINTGRTTTRQDADTEREKTSRNEKIARNILREGTTIVLVKAASGRNDITVTTKRKRMRNVIANGKATDEAGVVARIRRKIEIARDGGIAIAISKAMNQRENEIALDQGRIEINSVTHQMMTGFSFKALRRQRNS